MLDTVSLNKLIAVVHRDGRSFLQYEAESFPWTVAAKSPWVVTLQQLASEEAKAIGKILRFLKRVCHRNLSLGSYSSLFTSWNFVTLESILPRIIQDVKDSIAEVEASLAAIRLEEPRQILEEYLAMKQRHLRTLEELTQPKKATA